jgi:uncharacterized protein
MLTEEQIDAAAQRLVATLHPKKVILFGSYARGTATEHSDLDLMVVEPEGISLWNATIQGRKVIGRMGVGVDVLVVDQETFDDRKDWCSSPIYWAQVEGKVLYENSN